MVLVAIVCWQHVKLAELNAALATSVQTADILRSSTAKRDAENEALRQTLKARSAPAIAGMNIAPASDIPLENAIASWVAKVSLLSRYAEKHPEWHIRQLALLDDNDWLDATRGKLESEADLRTAFGWLRFQARKKTATEIGAALKMALDSGLDLTSPRQLLPFLRSDFDPTVLDQMEIIRPIQWGPRNRVLVDRPVHQWDSAFSFDAAGNWGAQSVTPNEYFAVSNAIRAYSSAHGSPPGEFSQLMEFPDVKKLDPKAAKEVFDACVTKPEL